MLGECLEEEAMRKGIIWAIRHGLSIRNLINKNGCNHFLLHIFSDGEAVIDATYVYDKKYKSLFKNPCKECEELKQKPKRKNK